MEGLQPIKFEPRTYHPTCHWLAGLNSCSSTTSNVKCYFYLPPPPLVETHIMKTYKWIARLLAEWIVAPLQRLCEQRTSSPSPALSSPIRRGEGRPALRSLSSELLLTDRDAIDERAGEGFPSRSGRSSRSRLLTGLPITNHQLPTV